MCEVTEVGGTMEERRESIIDPAWYDFLESADRRKSILYIDRHILKQQDMGQSV
jgi:hypothetical protein